MILKNAKSLTGILTFAIALTVYLLTLEPTSSFWDCSEFITCAYNLEVGHAPGAPVFMLLGRAFSLLASEPSQVAQMINALSAVSSAVTVMLLFFIIYLFAEKLSKKQSIETSYNNNFKLIAASFIGALSYAFTDSFWFSAVEAEVYATSSLFTALVFWAILKYSNEDRKINSYKWLILIFFILGLSVGIHLLNLLTLPAMALVVYFKHYKSSVKGILISLILSGFLLVLFIFGIIPGVVRMAASFDRVFVNSFNLPVYSGALFYVFIVSTILYFSFQYFKRKGSLIKQVVVLAFTFWLIGYSSFTILVIRSAQNPFVDINNVENIYGLVDYLNREQYPSRPLFYGNNYNSPIIESQKRYTYKYHNGRYFKDELNPKYIFDKNTLTPFPRMASMDERHIKAYKQWVNIKGRSVTVRDRNGEQKKLQIPTLKENILFFFKYQLGYMYGRYFMWNFSGKQNDIQGRGDRLHGNWLSGISLLDNFRLGDQSKLPDYYKNHKARNAYYMLPLLLGFLGLIYQYRKDKNNFLVNITLFFFTGIAIVLYLNEIPITPRERDYAHVGSFFVFAIWIGLGALGLIDAISQWQYTGGAKNQVTKKQSIKNNPRLMVGVVFILLLAAVPLNMLQENWDDHNRSNRYTARDYGKNMLNSCEKNAILFTTADNDTYPLWYLQEVEKYRPDIRNVLLTFLPVDWYADQLHHKHGEKGNIPISFKGKELLMHQNQYFPIMNKIDSFIEVGQLIDFVKSTNEQTQVRTIDNSSLNFIPGKNLKLKIDKAKFLETCSYLDSSTVEIPESIKFTLNESYLGRDELLILDMLANNNWERPIYFVYPHLIEKIGLADYLHREGMVYRFMPIKKSEGHKVATQSGQHQYKLLMELFVWGNVNQENVYLDHTNVQMVQSFRFRQMFIETANLLSATDETLKAEEILDFAQRLFPPDRIPYSWFMPEMVKAYQIAGAPKKASELAIKIEKEMNQRLQFSRNLGSGKETNSINQESLFILQQLELLKL